MQSSRLRNRLLAQTGQFSAATAYCGVRSLLEDLMDHFNLLHQEKATFLRLGDLTGPNGYFGQEVLRFLSMAGTLKANYSLDNLNADSRYISHVLARSLIEGFFWLTYIFDDLAKRQARYDEFLSSFKREYAKLYNDPMCPDKSALEPPDVSWNSLIPPMDIKSVMAQVKNDFGNRLDYLYVVYRIASFDTHGKNFSSVLETVFGKPCKFPVLKLDSGFDLMANQYLVILDSLRSGGEI